MALLKKMFGGGAGQKKDLTAREGYALALESLKAAHPAEADGAYPCCIYTSAADANVEFQGDGTCRGWHVDFFLPASRTLYLARVQNGKVRSKERAWDKTEKAPVEYVYALYGMQSERGILEPPRIADDWLDSPALAEAIQKTLEPHRQTPRGDELAAVTLFQPAEHLRYLKEEKAEEALSLPPAPSGCFAALCTTEDPYEQDSHLLYIGATTADVQATHVFRFPNLFYFGTSRDW